MQLFSFYGNYFSCSTSEFKDNVTSDTPTDPKDDFHLYANKDWLLENEIPDGYSTWSHYNERALEVKQQCMELLKDGTISGHDAELIRTFNDLILDWDTRDKLGISEGKEYYEKFLATENLDDITKLLTDKDTVDDYYNFVSFGATTGLNVPDTYLVVVDSSSLLLGDSAEYTNRSDYGDMLYGLRKDGFIYMAGKFGMSESDAENYFKKALELETKLSKKIYTTEDSHKDDFLDTIVAFNDNHFIGTNIDTEMVADMTGLQCALKMASKIDGFDYDKFFTKYAQMNVSLHIYSAEYSLLTQDEHPLDYSRTNVPVQQFQEFYDTYDVKEGDNMYLAPEDRLIIW